MEANLDTEVSRDETRNVFRQLKTRHPSAFTAVKFATGSAIGFLDTEIILTLGTLGLYGGLRAPTSALYSPYFIALNIFAFIVGVTVAFLINESLLVKREGYQFNYGLNALLVRLGKFQLIFLTGNMVMIAVELLLLKTLALPPVLGNFAGAFISFPVSYFFSMRFIWHLNGNEEVGTQEKYRKRIARLYLRRNPIADLPKRIVTQDRIYNLSVLENRFDISEAKGKREETRIEFAVKIDVFPES